MGKYKNRRDDSDDDLSFVEVEVSLIKQETEWAFLIVTGEDDTEHWIPKSQVDDKDKYAVGDEDVTISVVECLAIDRGMA